MTKEELDEFRKIVDRKIEMVCRNELIGLLSLLEVTTQGDAAGKTLSEQLADVREQLERSFKAEYGREPSNGNIVPIKVDENLRDM